MAAATIKGWWQALAGAVALAVLCPADAAAGETAGTIVRPEFYVTAIANHYSVDGELTSYDTVALTGELTIVSRSRHYWGGPFVDYRYSSVGRFDGNLNVGGYFRYNWPRWDATGWLFVNRSSGNDDTWLYATRLRYLLAPGHKVGGEALAPIETGAGRPRLMLGYYGALSEALSLNFLAGTHTGGSPDVVARVEFVWRVR